MIGGKVGKGMSGGWVGYNNVRWEKVSSGKFGVELGLLNKRVSG